MSKKVEFIEAFMEIVQESPETYYENQKWGDFTDILNEHPGLRELFNQAVDEVKESNHDPAYGLNQLFSFEGK